jgi:DNA-binding transcriptional LysR family regulator
MAKTNRKSDAVKRQGRRVMPTPRRVSRRAKATPSLLTVGELIAAAYDTTGGEPLEVLKLMVSPQMSRVLGRRVVLVG